MYSVFFFIKLDFKQKELLLYKEHLVCTSLLNYIRFFHITGEL